MPGTEILRVRCYTSSLFALKCRLTYFSSCLLHNLTYLNCFVELNSPKDVFATEHVLTPGEDMRFEPWTLVTTRGTLPRNRSHRAARAKAIIIIVWPRKKDSTWKNNNNNKTREEWHGIFVSSFFFQPRDRVRFSKKIQDWILKSERIRKRILRSVLY